VGVALRRWPRAAGALVLLGLAAAAVRAGAVSAPLRTAPPQPARAAAPDEATAAPHPDGVRPERLAADATIQVRVEYSACQQQATGEGPLPPGLVGMTRAQVARQFRETVIASFGPERLVLRRRLPGCPDGVVTLVERDGRVTVLAGRPGHLGGVVARTGLEARALGRAERLRLEQGIVVPAGAWPEALRALEGDPGAADPPRRR
jgi:hypothetical protein